MLQVISYGLTFCGGAVFGNNLPFMKMENRYQVNYTGERVNSTKEV